MSRLDDIRKKLTIETENVGCGFQVVNNEPLTELDGAYLVSLIDRGKEWIEQGQHIYIMGDCECPECGEGDPNHKPDCKLKAWLDEVKP